MKGDRSGWARSRLSPEGGIVDERRPLLKVATEASKGGVHLGTWAWSSGVTMDRKLMAINRIILGTNLFTLTLSLQVCFVSLFAQFHNFLLAQWRHCHHFCPSCSSGCCSQGWRGEDQTWNATRSAAASFRAWAGPSVRAERAGPNTWKEKEKKRKLYDHVELCSSVISWVWSGWHRF